LQIRDYWLTFSKRWWLIVLVAAAACASSFGYAKLQTPIYRAEVQLTVAPSRLDYGLTLVIDNLLTQYQQQLLTRQLASTVDDNLKLDRPVDSLLGEVKVSAISNGYLLAITVDDTDPNLARDISLVWAQKFIELHQAEMAPLDPHDRIEIKMLDKPITGSLFFPKTKQLVLAAGVLGLVVGAVLTFLLEYLDDTLKTPDDVERVTNLPVVGSIPIASEQGNDGARANGRARVAVAGGRKG
jgi:capsular polysaccharide biosynthesis protein